MQLVELWGGKMTHVRLPYMVVSTKFPGYFWDIKSQRLLTIKPSGILRPLKKPKPSHFNDYTDGYRVCVSGVRRWLFMDYLKSLQPHYHIIQVTEKPKQLKLL